MARKSYTIRQFKNMPENYLDDHYVSVYDNKRKQYKAKENMKKETNYDLNQIGETLNSLVTTVESGFKQVNVRIDRLEKRVDDIDARLDYIVKANKLKDL